MIKKCYIFTILFLLLFIKTSYAQILYSFWGNINLDKKELSLKVNFKDNSTISTQLTSVSENHFQFLATIEHLKTPLFDISTQLESSIELIQDENKSWKTLVGSVESKYSLFNYKPISELSGRFEIKEGKLSINSLSWGDSQLKGFLELFAPYTIDLSINFKEILSEELIALLGHEQQDHFFAGLVSGEISLSGFLRQPILKGKLMTEEGLIQGEKYEKIVINFSGTYPKITLLDSMITQEDGLSFFMNGDLDLSRGWERFGDDVKALEMMPVINENTTSHAWTIKRKGTKGSDSATEFKYRVLKNEKEETSFEDDTNMLGVERSIKF